MLLFKHNVSSNVENRMYEVLKSCYNDIQPQTHTVYTHGHKHTHSHIYWYTLYQQTHSILLVSLTSSFWPQESFLVFSSVLFHQQSSVPVLSSLARHAQRQKYLPDPTVRRWPLSLACHDSPFITGGFVMDGQLLKENFIHGVNGRRHRGCPDFCLACCRGKP